MREIAGALMERFPLHVCEAAFVYAHVRSGGTHFGRIGGVVSDVLEAAGADLEPAAATIGLPVDLDDLVVGFEALIDPEQRRRTGSVFTPAAVAQLLAERTITASTRSVIDPACGCGALLVHAARRLSALSGRPLRDVVHSAVHGIDSNPDSVRRARLLLSLLAGVPVNSDNITVGNVITDNVDAYGTFDAVVGNPPYVRYQDMSEDLRSALRAWTTTRSGNFNLYFAFFEAGRSLLNDDGRLAYVTPRSFLHLRSAAGLRRWFADTAFIDLLEDYDTQQLFDTALTYTCITSCDRRPRETLRYVRRGDVPAPAVPTTVRYSALGEEPWELSSGDAQRAVAALRTGPKVVALSDICDVRGGIATLRDRLFFVDDTGEDLLTKTFAGEEFRVERAATVPCVRVSDHADARSLAGNRRRVIYPYRHGPSGTVEVIPDGELRALWPETYRYLCAIRPELSARDRGKKTYPAWYAYGRSQGLCPVGPAVLSPLYAAEPRFLLDTTASRLFTNGTATTLKPDAAGRYPGLTLELLAALLHGSPQVRYLMEHTANAISGGYRQYNRRSILALPVPVLSAHDIPAFLNGSSSQRRAMLDELYGLSMPARPTGRVG